MWRVVCEIVLGFISLFAFWQWGKSNEKRKQAEKVAKEKIEDAEISTKPYVDKPFSKLRNKK